MAKTSPIPCSAHIISVFQRAAEKAFREDPEKADHSGKLTCTIPRRTSFQMLGGAFMCGKGTRLKISLFAKPLRVKDSVTAALRQVRMHFVNKSPGQGCTIPYATYEHEGPGGDPMLTNLTRQQATTWCARQTASAIVTACSTDPRVTYFLHADGDAEEWQGTPVRNIILGNLLLENTGTTWDVFSFGWKFQKEALFGKMVTIPFRKNIHALFVKTAGSAKKFQSLVSQYDPRHDLHGVTRFVLQLFLGKIDQSGGTSRARAPQPSRSGI
jgi:hypothetical protein